MGLHTICPSIHGLMHGIKPCWLLLSLALITPAYARVDAMQLRLLESYQQDLRWDNIESAPEWINGVKPGYNKNWQMHSVLLKPNQQVSVTLPAYESLRLYHPKQTLTPQALDVYASNGTGLAVKQALQTSTDGHSLVFSPKSPTPLLIHMVSPPSLGPAAGLDREFEVALFISRKVTLNDIAPYRNLIFLSAPWVLLTQEPFTLPELYWRLEANHKNSFVVRGPSRIAIKNRLSFEPLSSELIQDYRLQYRVDQSDKQWLDFSTSVETSRLVAEIISNKNPVNNILNASVGLLLSTVPAPVVEVVGREQQAYIEVPAGYHQIELQPDRSLYVQVLAQTEHDYLFPTFNNPRLPVEEIRKQGLLSSTELMLQEQTSKRIVQANNHRAGGMLGSLLLQQSALERLDYPPGLTEAEQLRGFRTFYRDLLPSKKAAATPQFMSYFLSGELRAVNRPQQDAILADQHLAEALKRVANGYFTGINATGEHAANEYTLPEQHTPGQLRLIVDKRDCIPRLLKIQMDQQQPSDLWLRCAPDLPAAAFVRSLEETALIRLQQEHEHPANSTLSALFSAYQQPARLIPTAVYELALPQSIRNIKIWQASNLTAPVNLALQYRSSKPFLFSESSYQARLRDSSRSRLQQQFFQDLRGLASDKSMPEQQLQNEWLGLERLVLSEYRLFKAAVAQKPATQALYSKSQISETINLAKAAERQQQWLEALEYWGDVVNHAQDLQQQQAQLAQAVVLSKLGEHYLAESLRRYLSLYADESISEQAIQQLTTEYRQQHDAFALQTLAAAILVQRPSSNHILQLMDALLQNGEYRFVLLLGLTFIEPAPPESLLRAAYQLEWWQAYQQIVDRLPEAKRAFWIGIKAQKQGHYQAALQAWSSEESRGWREPLQQGQDLLDQFNHLTEKNALPLYQQWSAWQQHHPGPTMWQETPWHVQDYAGSDSYYSTERDLYGKAFRATQQRPVVLGIMGPATLSLQIRPLHAAYAGMHPIQQSPSDPVVTATSVLDGWIRIIDNKKAQIYPFFNNTPSQGLDLSGSGNVLAGNLETLDYQVGSGWHELLVFSEQAPLSLSVLEQRPEFALTILPRLYPDSFDNMNLMKDRSLAGARQREKP
ncbi:MAG: hypothetical protein HOP23_01125 [Methylococcaceae bacterium]|nr:hypothetical protein [Methylococcaceae bacterium]